MAVLEKEAVRLAESLDDYEHVSVTAVGGSDQSYWVVVRDNRFNLEVRDRVALRLLEFHRGAGRPSPVPLAEAAEGGGLMGESGALGDGFLPADESSGTDIDGAGREEHDKCEDVNELNLVL